MDYKKIANEILDLIGGSKNVATLEHCSTRLRFSLVDKSVVDVEKIKKSRVLWALWMEVNFRL